jgi:plasmid maintenance system killer protein
VFIGGHFFPAPGWNRWQAIGKANTASESNDRYRVCFVWAEGDAAEVEIVDYH